MARKRTPEPQAEAALRIPPSQARTKIDERIAKGNELLARTVESHEDLSKLDDDYDKWNAYNSDLLGQMCTTKKLMHEYAYSGAAPIMFAGGPPSAGERLSRLKDNIAGKITCFESIKERLELFPLAAGVEATPAASAARSRPHTNRAFIVHGHEEGVRETVARLLQRLGVEPIILHEKATEGRTIVEKLEHYSDVDFAVIILTSDDVGAAKGEPERLQPRARQNVILELGYFVGKLGRDKVCALYQAGVEMPSDYLGVGYVPLDPGGGWQLQLARELRAAGFDIDMNAL